MIVIFDLATGAMVRDNVAALPEDFDVETFGWCEQPGRYPDDLTWSTDLRGFTDARRAAVPVRHFTFNQWVDLFSLEEQVAIVTATMSDPMAKLIYDRAQSASGSIDPTDPRTAQGLGYLVSKGYVEQSTFDRIAAS